jgi:3-oxoacyl-[acyl-carrier-protein] synthase II
MRRRVVITGIGLISPVGPDAPSSWKALLEGRSGISTITKFDPSALASRIAGEVTGFDPLEHFEKKEARKMDTFSHYAIVASREAVRDGGLTIEGTSAESVGVYIGSGIGGVHMLLRNYQELVERGPRRVSAFLVPGMIINLASGNVSIDLGAKGPNLSVATACATGTHAIGESFRLIREGYADAMITGGTEGAIHPLTVAGFASMKALSTRNDDPERASRPFDLDRDGFVMGEGAGVLLLEERDAALARGARIYAEVVGYGLTGDAYHISAPSEDGEGAVRCMRMALKDAGMEPERVDYINAHGTSTPTGDKIETRAVKEVFGAHAGKLVFGSTKSMTGHLLGAAGGLESIVTCLAVHHDVVPPTINVERQDPECDLDCAASGKRELPVGVALNNSFGFGGTNATILLAKHEIGAD